VSHHAQNSVMQAILLGNLLVKKIKQGGITELTQFLLIVIHP
jgi:hypothetical protein